MAEERSLGPLGLKDGEGKALARGLLAGVCALLTAFALSVDLSALPVVRGPESTLTGLAALFSDLMGAVDGEGPLFLVLAIALAALYLRLLAKKQRFLPSAALVAALFALFLLVGQSYDLTDSWDPLLADSLCRGVALAMLLGYGVFFYLLIAALFRRLDRRGEGAPAPLRRRERRRLFLLAFGVLAVCWLPYLLLCYPGSLTYDAQWQLGQFFGQTPATNHHPWFSTLLLGWIVSLGKLWSLNAGLFLYVLFQSAVCAAVFAGICVEVRTLTGRGAAFWAALLYYALVPSWGAYAQMVVKDTIFYGVFAGFCLLLVKVLRKRGRCGPALWAGLVLLGLACALLRNNGLYAVVPALLCLAAALRGRRARALAAGGGAAVLAVWLAFHQLLLPALGVEPGSSREMYSLPFQQTARYVAMYGEELTAEDIAVIDSVLDYEMVRDWYDPRVADTVKNTYHGTDETMEDYWRLWLDCGRRHPDAYLQATLNLMFGYLLPGYRYGVFGGNYFMTQDPRYGIDVDFAFPEAASAVDYFSRLWSETPGLLLLNAPGTHAWALVLCTAALLRKRRWRGLAAAVPLWITLAVCCVSPVNGLVRYALPLMAATPLLLAFVWREQGQREDGEEDSHG